MTEQITLGIRQWLIRLGRANGGHISTDEAADFVDTIQPMLATNWPEAAFTFASLEHVAAACRYLPTYGEITEHLGDWWRRHRKLAALPYEPPKPPEPHTAEERAHASWVASQTIAALRSSAQPVEERRVTPKHLTREQLARAYQQAGVRDPYRVA